MARKIKEDDDDDIEEEEDEPQKKGKKFAKGDTQVFIPRAVSIPEMFNIINDKLDIILGELKK